MKPLDCSKSHKISLRDKKQNSNKKRQKSGRITTWHERNTTDLKCYKRSRDLIAFLPLWPADINDRSVSGARSIIDKITKALHQERRRARTRHWSYSLSRHIALAKAIKAERLHLISLLKDQT